MVNSNLGRISYHLRDIFAHCIIVHS